MTLSASDRNNMAFLFLTENDLCSVSNATIFPTKNLAFISMNFAISLIQNDSLSYCAGAVVILLAEETKSAETIRNKTMYHTPD